MRYGAALAIVLLTAPGCVTVPSKPSAQRSGATANAAAAAQLPNGPIAAPAHGVITNTHVVLGLTPVGTVPYDGQVLPLISPDGHFCAVEEGEAPTWGTLVAAPDAEVPSSTHLAVYDLTVRPPARVTTAQELEPGLMLGRACDSRGFLVEAPRPDGSRWIGRATWQSGRVEWLAREEAVVCAHGVLTLAGDLVFTRRPVTGQVAELVVRTSSGTLVTRSEGDRPYAMPMTTNDPGTIYAMCLTPSGIEVHALAYKAQGPGAPKLGPVLARRMLCGDRDVWAAYQIAAPLQGPIARHADPGILPEIEPLVIPNPAAGRMSIFDVRSGSLFPLAANSIAAVRWTNASKVGYLCTTPKGLVFSLEPSSTAEPHTPEARMLFESYVPRLTSDANRPALLLGPVKTDPHTLEIIGIAPSEVVSAEGEKPRS